MTMELIAERAGVSVATVSRVVNNHSTVRPDLVRKVRGAMEAAGYTPKVSRRGPKAAVQDNGRSVIHPIVHVLFGRGRELLSFSHSARLVAGMTEAAQLLQIPFMIVEMPDRTRLPELLRNEKVSGCIAAGHPPRSDTAEVFHPLPVVWVGSGTITAELDQVAGDYRQEGVLAAQYLLEKGCKHPAFINHDPSHLAFPVRRDAFLAEAAQRNGNAGCFEPEPSSVTEPDAWAPDRVRAVLGGLLDRALSETEVPDGMFFPTDQQAAIAHTLLRERGVEPEKDVVIVACNNDEPWRATMHLRSATIDNRPEQVGRSAVRLLVERIQHPNDAHVHIAVQPRLVLG